MENEMRKHIDKVKNYGQFLNEGKFGTPNDSGLGMSVSELIQHLSKFDGDLEVMLLDGFNAQGNKRSITFAPAGLREITLQDEEESGDCEDKIGNKVVILGFGYY